MLTRNGKRGHPVLFRLLEGKLSIFTVEYGIICEFVIDMAFIMLSYVSSIPNLLNSY